MQEATIAAIATAPGAGGIAVVRLSGAESYQVAARVFHPANPAKKVEEAKATPRCSGISWTGKKPLTRALLCFSVRPTAIPARTWWNFPATAAAQWRGGWWRPVLQRVRSRAAPGEYTRRAFLNASWA